MTPTKGFDTTTSTGTMRMLSQQTIFYGHRICEVYRNWIWEYSGTPHPIILFYGIVFGQIKQLQIHNIFFHRMCNPNTMEAGSNRIAIVFAVFDLNRRVPRRKKSPVPSGKAAHPAHTSSSHPRQRGPILGTQHFEHLHNT